MSEVFVTPARYVATGAKPRCLQDGSDLWLALEQLQHGPLSQAELSELLDMPMALTCQLISRWRRFRYVRRLRVSDGEWVKPEPKPCSRASSTGTFTPQILAHLRAHGQVTSDDIMAMFECSRKAAHSRISMMVRRRHIVQAGHDTARGRVVYVLSTERAGGPL